jgi:hypothetical protein
MKYFGTLPLENVPKNSFFSMLREPEPDPLLSRLDRIIELLEGM